MSEKNVIISLSGITLIIFLRFGVYPLVIMGWSSNRKYALLGSIRGIAQTISYEIRLALLLFYFILISNSVKLTNLVEINSELILVLFLTTSLFWLLSCIAETNRTPFDFAEGESELVSGFNVEYGAGGFTLIFIAEYSIILFFS